MAFPFSGCAGGFPSVGPIKGVRQNKDLTIRLGFGYENIVIPIQLFTDGSVGIPSWRR
jgi:hypothetical protein